MISDVAYTSSLSIRVHASKGGGGTMISTPRGRLWCCFIVRFLCNGVVDDIILEDIRHQGGNSCIVIEDSRMSCEL